MYPCISGAADSCFNNNGFSPMPGSVWEIGAKTLDGTRLWRIMECPAGFTVQRFESAADLDDCIPCKDGYYLLQPSFANLSVACLPCPIGGYCPGGDIVISQEGYWRRDVDHIFNRALSSNSSIRHAEIFRCSPNACQGNNQCRNNATGPVCGVCRAGWAFTSNGCVQCPPESIIAPIRDVAIALFLVTFCIFWYRVSWRALIPELGFLSTIFTRLVKCFSLCFGAKGDADDIANMFSSIRDKFTWLIGLSSKYNVTQYLKIFISYFQVLSSFVFFQVQWPTLIVNIMVWLKVTFNFSILELPGLSCLWAGISFRTKLLVYTLGPLIMASLFLLPVMVELLLVCFRKPTSSITVTIDLFWNNIMFLSFLVYPMVSLMTLQSFNCQPIGLGLLAADYREQCPAPYSFLRNYSSFFILIYPIGVPLWMFVVMLRMNVHDLARKKVNSGLLSSMIALFVKRASSVESKRLAQLVGQPHNEEEFNRRCHLMFASYFQGNVSDYISEKRMCLFDIAVSAEIFRERDNIVRSTESSLSTPKFKVTFNEMILNASSNNSCNGMYWEEKFDLKVAISQLETSHLTITTVWDSDVQFHSSLQFISSELLHMIKAANLLTKTVPIYAEKVVQESESKQLGHPNQFGAVTVKLSLKTPLSPQENLEIESKGASIDELQNFSAVEMDGTDSVRLRNFILQFDKDGNGLMDYEEFITMMKNITDVAWLFTGAEGGDHIMEDLSEKQLKSLLKHKWPSKNEPPDNENDPVALAKVVDHIQTQKHDNDEENMTPSALYDSTLESMSQTQLLSKVLDLGRTLRSDGIIVLPQLGWNMSSTYESQENIAIRRVGFLFLAYRVEYWYWETIEMFRKYVFQISLFCLLHFILRTVIRRFLMTSLLVVVVYPGEPAQIAAGQIPWFP